MTEDPKFSSENIRILQETSMNASVDEGILEKGGSLNSAGIIIVNCDKVFLFRRDMGAPRWKGCWQFPAGECEPGESIEITIERECNEEISHAPYTRTLIGIQEQNEFKEKGIYWAEVDDKEAQLFKLNTAPISGNQEGIDARFWPIDDAIQLTDEELTPGTAELLHQHGNTIKKHALNHTIPSASELELGLQ